MTDVVSGAYQQASFVIAQVTTGGASFYTVPSEVTFTGPRVGVCAGGGISSDFFVFGGTPPYSVLGAGGAALTYTPVPPQTVAGSGGRFTVFPQGICFPDGIPLSITDSAGRTITATVKSKEGTATVPAVQVAPDTVTLDTCSASAAVTVVGGVGSYLQPTSTNSGVFARMSTLIAGSATLSISRSPASSAIPGSPPQVIVAVSDGVSTPVQVKVNLVGAALGACP
jgi:hypothetical protein